MDYGSSDGLSDWVWQNLTSYIENNKLLFFEVTNEVRWNVARAKNLAHRLARGNYLFNLDADNFVTSADISVIKHVAEMGLPAHQWSGVLADGSFGRIGVSAELFKTVGGYDETFLPMGHQDIDFLNRLVAMDQKRATLPAPALAAIQNTIADKVTETKLSSVSYPDPVKAYEFMDWINDQISQFRLKTEGPIRLGGGFSYKGFLNRKPVSISGLDEIRNALEEPPSNQK